MTEDFWLTVGALADTIFPADEGSAAATGIGVLGYIRRLLDGPLGEGAGRYRQAPFCTPDDTGHGWQSPLTPAQLYRRGIAALDQYCEQARGVPFRDLDDRARADVLTAVDDGRAGPDGPEFVTLLREHVIEGLFSDPAYGGNAGRAGWHWLGYPGPPALETDYSEPRGGR